MPNRILKESIKFSPEIDRLTWFEEVVFYRLIVTADDYGRLDGRIIVLRNELFPTKENITRKAIEEALNKLVSVGLLIPYVDEVSNMPYYYLPTWSDHQRIRDSKAKYPAPTESSIAATRGNLRQLAATCRESPQLAATCGLESNPNPIQSESKTNTKARVPARFAPPTEDDVKAYADEMGYAGFNSASFVAYYEANGWRVGRNPMKDWKAAVRGWHSRDGQRQQTAVKTNPATDYQQRDYRQQDEDSFFLDLTKEFGGEQHG